MSRRARVAVGLTAFGVAAAGFAAALGRSVSEVVALEALAFVPYAYVIARNEAPNPKATLALAALAALPSLFAPALLSDDLFRYLWDGRVLLHGLSPYAKPPDDPSLAYLRDEGFASLNHAGIATIYPPVAEMLFAAASPFGPLGPKSLALAAHLATTLVVARLAGGRARSAAFAYAQNPLAIVECAMSGHVDVVAALFLALAVLALAHEKALRSALFAALATGTKLVGLLVVPILLARDRRAGGLLLALSLLLVAPLATAGGSADRAGLANYARRWRGNEGAYALVESAYTHGLLACCESAPRRVLPPFANAFASLVAGTPFDPRHTFLGPKKEASDRADFHLDSIVPFLARATVAALVLALAVVVARRRVEPVLAMRHVLLAALLLAPQVHPWYLVLLLPFEAASGRTAGLVYSAAVLVAYAPLDAWRLSRAWNDPFVARALEHALVFAFVLVEEMRVRAADQRALVLS